MVVRGRWGLGLGLGLDLGLGLGLGLGEWEGLVARDGKQSLAR